MQHATDNRNNLCAGFLDHLDMWLARELDAEQNLLMQAHLDACPACQLETRLARAINAITAALPAQVCPALQLPVMKETRNSRAEMRQQTTSHAAPGPSYVARLLHTWRQPLVYVPALVLVLMALLVVQLRVADTAVEPEVVIIDGHEYTREEIVRATADLQIALRYLDKYGSYPARVVQSELEQSRLPLPRPQTSQNTPSI